VEEAGWRCGSSGVKRTSFGKWVIYRRRERGEEGGGRRTRETKVRRGSPGARVGEGGAGRKPGE
jgi:hypothetical protein